MEWGADKSVVAAGEKRHDRALRLCRRSHARLGRREAESRHRPQSLISKMPPRIFLKSVQYLTDLNLDIKTIFYTITSVIFCNRYKML